MYKNARIKREMRQDSRIRIVELRGWELFLLYILPLPMQGSCATSVPQIGFGCHLCS